MSTEATFVAADPSADTRMLSLPAPLLAASGIEKSYRRGVRPARHRRPVLRGVDLALSPAR